MPSCSVKALRELIALGEKQYSIFRLERFTGCSKSVSTVIPKNHIKIFVMLTVKIKRKLTEEKVKCLKQSAPLSGRMYITAQHRSVMLVQFFSHEIYDCPPSLAVSGSMHEESSDGILVESN